MSDQSVLDRVFEFLGRFVAYPSEHAHLAHALWILHTHLMECWESTPRIAFLSPEPESGKTRAQEVTELLVPNPVMAVNVTPSYLFRKVGDEEKPPTILYDEIDTVFGPKAKENEEIRGLLNAGHRRGAVAGRAVVRGKRVTTEEIPAYSAVSLSGIGDLPDTILSRSVVINMRRRAPHETVESFRRRIVRPQGEELHETIKAWAVEAHDLIDGVWPDMPESITDRDADIWEPLLSVADAAGDDWPIQAREAAEAMVSESHTKSASLGVRLLADLRFVFDGADGMHTETILETLNSIEEAPWNDLYGKPLDARGLARRLRNYEVSSKNVRIGEVVQKGYTREDLYDAWLRYLGPEEIDKGVQTQLPEPDIGTEPYPGLDDAPF